MPSQLVKCAFGFNDPKTKCVPLSVKLGSEYGEHVPPVPPYVAGPETMKFYKRKIKFAPPNSAVNYS